MADFNRLKQGKNHFQKNFKHCFLKEYDAHNVDDPVNGRLYVTPDGSYPSVTTFLSAVTDKAFLEEWKKKVGEEWAAEESERCANRGSGVHLALEYLLRNKPDPTLAGDYRQMYVQLETVLRINVDFIHGLEIPLWSKLLGLAGRIDCLANYKGQLSIIDFKTSTKFKRVEFITNYFLQATCYSLMVEEMYGLKATQLVIMIGLESDLKPQVFIRDRRDYLPLLADKLNQFRLIQAAKLEAPKSLFDLW
jgi:hypothetical protein